MIVPVAVFATIGARLILPPDEESQPTSLDWTGFLSLSIAIAAMQIILSRGQRLDWFESTEITVATFVGLVAFYVFLVHSLTAKNPFLDLRLLLDRNFALGLLLVGLFGMVNFTPMVLLPPLLQSHLGYTDRLIGIMVGWRGIGVAMGFFLAMMTGRLDPRITMIIGFGVQIFSGIWLMAINLDVDFVTLAINAFMQGTAVGLIWAPIATTAFWTLPSRSRAEAASMFHLVRNIASSFFISICVALVVRATGANYSRLVENVSPYSKQLMLTPVIGGWHTETIAGLAALSKEINRQAAMIAYTNAFFVYTLVSLSAIPLALLGAARTATGRLTAAATRCRALPASRSCGSSPSRSRRRCIWLRSPSQVTEDRRLRSGRRDVRCVGHRYRGRHFRSHQYGRRHLPRR